MPTGFYRSATIAEIIARLAAQLEAEFNAGRRVEAPIRDNLRRLDFAELAGGRS